MFCPTCHAPVTPETIFCPRCGAEQRAVAPPSAGASSPGMPVPSPLGEIMSAEAPDLSRGIPPGAALYVVPLTPLVRLFGPRADPADAAPRTRAQALLRRVLTPRNATNLWLTAVLGALVALALGLLLGIPLMLACNTEAVASTLTVAGVSTGSAIATATYQVLPVLSADPVTFFLFANHLPFQLTLAATVVQGGPFPTYWLTLPVLGSLLAPALALVAGGYLSASSLAVRVPRYAVARGALIGPFYGAALFALADVAAGRPSSTLSVAGSVPYVIAPQVGWALLYGTLWGVVFGALGGWLAVSGRAWLSAALAVLRFGHRPRLAGALAGAAAAFLWGMLIFFALTLGVCACVAMLAASGNASPVITSGPVPDPFLLAQPLGAPRSLALAVGFDLVFGLPFALWLFSLAAGAPWQAFETSPGFPSSVHASLGLVGAQSVLPAHLWLPLALVPLISYIAGGRVAARVYGAVSRHEAFVAGAAMALPLAALMALAALGVSIQVDLSAIGQGISTAGVGPSVAGTFLVVLAGGAVAGGLGGLSTCAAPWLSRLARLPLVPLRLLMRPLFGLVDRLSRRDRTQPPSLARTWCSAGVLAVLAFGLLAVVAAIVTVTHASASSFQQLRLVDAALGGLLVGAPALCFGGALLTALFARTDGKALPAFESPLSPAMYVVFPSEAQVPHVEPAMGP